MHYRVEPQLNPMGLAELLELYVIELGPVVSDDHLWYVEPCDDVLPDEPFYLFLNDGRQWFNLDAFGEVVNPNYEQPLLSRGRRRRTKEIHP